MRSAVNPMRDVSPRRRDGLVKRVVERETARLRWQQATFAAVVTWLPWLRRRNALTGRPR